MTIEAITLHQIRCDHCTDLNLGNDACWQTDDGPMLFDTAAQALDCVRSELLGEGWTTDGTRHHCESCSKLFPLVDPDPAPEPVPVLPGQLALGTP